jgi:integrase
MSVRRIKNHGTWVWQTRVAYRGLRKAAFRPSKEAAREAEAQLLQELKAKAAAADQVDQAPATLRQLLDFYAEDLGARGRGEDSVERVVCTRRALEAVMPELLDRPVSAIGDADVFAFRNARARYSARAAELRTQGGPTTHCREGCGGLGAGARGGRGGAPRYPAQHDKPRPPHAAGRLKRARPDYRFPGGAFFREDETRVRWLRPEEELLVLEPMPSPFREIAKLAALTLMRMSEIRTLRRDMVHLEQGVVMLPRAKAGARPVILSGEAQKALGRRLEAASEATAAAGWLFPGPDGLPYSREHVGRVWRRAARSAGLRDFHFTICGATGRPWPSTAATRRRSSRPSAAGRPSA